ncbi:MAG: hypothetical protein LCH84_02190 [Gemmatimonadetes bacterium]|nr:hypothetical protein [Gemmatimonadota bacterium]
MTWILVVMWGLVAVLAAMFVGGLTVPVTRTVTRTVTVPAPREATWALLRTVDTTPAWCAALPRMDVRREVAPASLDLVLLDDTGQQTGAWTLSLADGADGATRVALSESATVKNPLLRFLRSFRNPARRVDAFLIAAAAQLGEDDATPRDG